MRRRDIILMVLLGLLVALLWWMWPRSTAIEPPPPASQPASHPQRTHLHGRPAPQPKLRAAFGQELGRRRPAEGNPEAPMSLAVDRQGQLVVLDQVNERLVRPGRTPLPLPVRAAQDVLVTSAGIAVLDRLADRQVALLDDNGKSVGALPLEGRGIKEGGSVTGLFEDSGKLYAEREHGMLVELGTVSGQPSTTRGELPGRPTRDGRSYVAAGLMKGGVYVSAIDRVTGANRFTRQVTVSEPVRAIAHLDSDKQGRLHLVLQLEHQHLFFCLSGEDGGTLSHQVLAISHEPEETFRTFATSDGGALFQAIVHPDGMEYVQHACS